MSPQPEPRLSGLQLSLLRALWDQGEGTVQSIRLALEGERPLAATTVATLLKRLEKRGLVSHRTEGRSFVYRAEKSAEEIERTLVTGLVDDLYGGKAEALFARLLSSDLVPGADLARIRALIEEREAADGS